ncbi:MAG: aminotransferase class V-fold PLP-dependent enzyme, partial [Bacteroidales bacterium]|nr:aminotransferase class V-fold PLP-dependent enzyme [Bacteroidales bacterium]
IHGPKGVGALYIGNHSGIQPLLHGGGQEGGLRAGTENLPAIAGFAKAVELNFSEPRNKQDNLRNLKNRFYNLLNDNIKDIRINTPEDSRAAPHILNVSFPGIKGEVLLRQLESKGVYVSTGSACTSGRNKTSHVLEAMGLKKTEAEGALRFSFSVLNTPDEIDYTEKVLVSAVTKLQKMAKF